MLRCDYDLLQQISLETDIFLSDIDTVCTSKAIWRIVSWLELNSPSQKYICKYGLWDVV